MQILQRVLLPVIRSTIDLIFRILKKKNAISSLFSFPQAKYLKYPVVNEIYCNGRSIYIGLTLEFVWLRWKNMSGTSG